MPLRPRIQVIGPTPDVPPGTAGGFPASVSAAGTPIKLRITDDVEQKVAFWLSWKNPTGITFEALKLLDAPMRRRLFERAPDRVVLNGEQADYASLVAAVKTQYPSITAITYANTQRIPAGTRIASRLHPHYDANRDTELLKRASTGQPFEENDGTLWVDITVQAPRTYAVGAIGNSSTTAFTFTADAGTDNLTATAQSR